MLYFLAFALIPVLVIGTINYFQAKASNTNSAFDTLRGQENISKVFIQDKIKTLGNVGKQSATSSLVKDYVKTINDSKQDAVAKDKIKAAFKEMNGDFPYYENIALTDKNGKTILDNTGKLENQDLGQMNYFTGAKNDNKIYISPVKKSITTGNPVIVISEPIVIDNQFQGILLQSVDLTAISKDLLTNMTIGKDGQMFVIENESIR